MNCCQHQLILLYKTENQLQLRENILLQHEGDSQDLEVRLEQRWQQYYTETMYRSDRRYRSLHDEDAHTRLKKALIEQVYINYNTTT